MGYRKNTYIGAYLEIIDKQGIYFDVLEINEVLFIHDQSSEREDKKIFWLPNISSNACLVYENDHSDQNNYEILEGNPHQCINCFNTQFSEAIEKLKAFYGNGTIKFGYVTGFN